MNLKQLSHLTENGQEAVRRLLADTETVGNPSERRERALAIVNDPEMCAPIEGAGFVDLDARFATALEFVEHVYAAVEPLGTSGIRDRGINLFLYCAYIDQLIKAKARKLESYFLDEKTKGKSIDIIRNYRNTVFVSLSFYHLHRDNREICLALMNGSPNELSNAMEKIAQSNDIMGSKAAMELVVAMLFDPRKGGYRKAPKPKSKLIKSKNAGQALQELSSIVFKQCSRNYDVSRMSARQLFKLVPNTNGLSGWKKYAEERFQEAEQSAGDDGETHAAGNSPTALAKPEAVATSKGGQQSHADNLATMVGAHFGKPFARGGKNEIASIDGSVSVKAAYANVNPLKGENSVHFDVPGNAFEHDYFAVMRLKDGQAWLFSTEQLKVVLLGKNPVKPKQETGSSVRWDILIKSDASGDWIGRGGDRIDVSGFRIDTARQAAAA